MLSAIPVSNSGKFSLQPGPLQREAAPVAMRMGWYSAYRAAMLENRLDRAQHRIERALRAIESRRAEVRRLPQNSGREPEDLNNALHHLRILLQHLGTEAGRVLWE